ncbi:MAG: GTPase ObgE [Deltaproteobacteria bacterium]|nr:GTPase ObgE [Deltaproteobacteria bacterium]
MKFVDEATLELKAGDGGNGCVSFRREKRVPRGGPDGGDGGDGGDCTVKAESGLTTLLDLKMQRRYQAGRGEHGRGKNQFGKRGADCLIVVPVGTLVRSAESQEVLFDFTREGQTFVAARGGRGGHGNTHYATSTRQSPRTAQEGQKGEIKKILLELKLLADVGLLGLPNAGKSTLISVISKARPKIADYPFTTKIPHLGVVRIGEERSFVAADIPGLIEGAHDGKGMGVQFLKHIERTRVLLHLIDLTDPAQPDPCHSYQLLRGELAAYSPELLQKPELIVLTKMDLPEARSKRGAAEKKFLAEGKKVFFISAVKHEGLQSLLTQVGKLLWKEAP